MDSTSYDTSDGVPADQQFIGYMAAFTGCKHGGCFEPNYPALASRIQSEASSWSFNFSSTGRYDAVYDAYFNTTPTEQNVPTGAELMIWLNEQNIALMGPQLPDVTIDGTQWHVFDVYKQTAVGSWNRIAFERVTPVTSVSNLDVAPFVQAAISDGAIAPDWYQQDLESGFEIWSGGVGLTTYSFSANPPTLTSLPGTGSGGTGGLGAGGAAAQRWCRSRHHRVDEAGEEQANHQPRATGVFDDDLQEGVCGPASNRGGLAPRGRHGRGRRCGQASNGDRRARRDEERQAREGDGASQVHQPHLLESHHPGSDQRQMAVHGHRHGYRRAQADHEADHGVYQRRTSRVLNVGDHRYHCSPARGGIRVRSASSGRDRGPQGGLSRIAAGGQPVPAGVP